MKKKLIRCNWCQGQFEEYITYHDKEWGVPVHDDYKLFEFLILEGAQAGLSWATILKRREGYRKAFAGFDPEKVSRFGESKVEKLMMDTGIIRNRLKILSAINNARCFMKVKNEYGSFDRFIWQFTDGKPKINHFKNTGEIKPTSIESDQLSKELKRQGFSFVGSTIIYAYMQAIGMVNDHLMSCFRYKELSG
jgi:DNA-3-methyladenine glycosylase I